MNNKTRQMIKDVIEENAVQFKTSTTSALYEKVGNALGKKYAELSKALFEDAQGGDIPVNDAGQAIQSPSGDQSQTARPDRSLTAGSLYDPNQPFWKTQMGQAWSFYWNYLVQNWNNPAAWGRPGTPPQYASREAYQSWCLSKLPKGVYAPPFRK
jgi:hypothetical protein